MSERTNQVLVMEVRFSNPFYGVSNFHANSLTLLSTTARLLFPTLALREGTDLSDLRENICIRYVKWRSPN